MFYFLLYNIILIVAYPFLLVFFLISARNNHKYTGTMMERFGFYKGKARPAGGAVWVHAVSVGEAVGATPLVRLLLEKEKGRRIVVTTTTKGGMEVLKNTFGDSITAVYFPIDFPWVVRRALNFIRPSALVLMETEIWPNVVSSCGRRGAPVVLLNGRVSDRMAQSRGVMRRLYAYVFLRMKALGMQTEEDARRIIALGAPADVVRVVGNMKFDGMITSLDSAKIEELALTTAAGGGTSLFVAGSTHPGEETILLDVFVRLRAKQSGLKLVIAPRHIERSAEVATMCRIAGWKTDMRSGHGPENPCGGDVIVWDTIGELRYLYSLAAVCFVGGSLIERGGHNILEPAACGRAAFYGPYTANFRASVEALEKGGGGVRVGGPAELLDALEKYLSNEKTKKEKDEAALEVVKRNAGSSARAYELFKIFDKK